MKKTLLLASAGLLLFTACTKDDDTTSQNYVIDFENVPATYLAGPTAYGDNLYSDYSGARYTGYTDPGSGLRFALNYADDWSGTSQSYEFWNGGTAISQWNEMTGATDANQCSVYYRDDATGFGGYGGSKTFAVVNGFNAAYADARSIIAFDNAATERVFDHFYVNNTTYVRGVAQSGNDYAAALSTTQGWLKVIAEGLNKAGQATGTVEFYLVDFRPSSSTGVVTQWTKINLSPLGAVHKIRFDFAGSDSGDFGLNTPAYFCFDNLALQPE